jgi:hypothetical protein
MLVGIGMDRLHRKWRPYWLPPLKKCSAGFSLYPIRVCCCVKVLGSREFSIWSSLGESYVIIECLAARLLHLRVFSLSASDKSFAIKSLIEFARREIYV